MEGGGGGGSRMSRASSRYGSTAVFNGPVRRWKKRWVHVPSPSFNGLGNCKGRFQSNNGSPLFLCRWTPIGGGGAVLGDGDGSGDEPPKRKFRYTPVAVLEEQRKAGKIEEGMSENLQGAQKRAAEDGSNYCMDSKAAGIKIEKKVDSKKNRFDLGLSLVDPDEDNGP